MLDRCVLTLLVFAALTPVFGQDFSGSWRLKSETPRAGSLPQAPSAMLRIEHQGNRVRWSGEGQPDIEFAIDGKEYRVQAVGRQLAIIAKWEGAALLINTIVNGPSSGYTEMDRWRISRDGATLTIQREVVRRSRNSEATLVYERDGAVAAAAPAKPAEYVVEAGTRVPLTVLNSVSTKQSREGDRVYLRTSFPVVVRGRVTIPAGSYVAGTLTLVKRPGRIKGRGELYLRFDSLTLPNGTTRDFRSRVGALDGQTEAELDRKEGGIRGEGDKAGDARKVGETAATGAGVGAIAGAAANHPGMGVGIGAAAGAAAGVMAVLLTRGPEILLARGASLEMVLDRPLRFTTAELDGARGVPGE